MQSYYKGYEIDHNIKAATVSKGGRFVAIIHGPFPSTSAARDAAKAEIDKIEAKKDESK